MEIQLKYGTGVLRANLPAADTLKELSPKSISTLLKPEALLQRALEKPVGTYPLSRLLHKAKNLVIVVAGNCFAGAAAGLLPLLLEHLNAAEVPDDEIRILVANAGSRLLNDDELASLVSPELMQRLSVFQHDSRDSRFLEYVGETQRLTPIFANRLLLDADQIILFGALNHHYLAGYGAGPRLLVPGCAGSETIARNMLLAYDTRTRHLRPECADGRIRGNPVYEDSREAYGFISAAFGVYPVFNGRRQMISLAAGHPLQAHAAASQVVDSMFKLSVRKRADLTIAGGSGWPCDADYLRVFQALQHAARITKKGGRIVLVAECKEGLGSPAFARWFDDSERRHAQPRLHAHFSAHFIQAMRTREIAGRFKVVVVSKLAREIVSKMGFAAAVSLEEACRLACSGLPETPLVYLLPDGVRTAPFVR